MIFNKRIVIIFLSFVFTMGSSSASDEISDYAAYVFSVFDLVRSDGSNQVKDCFDKAKALDEAMIEIKLNGHGHDGILDFLKKHYKDAPEAIQDRIIRVWENYHTSGAVSALEFDICMNNKKPLGELGLICFDRSSIFLHARVMRRREFSKSKAVSELKLHYSSMRYPDDFYESAIEVIYSDILVSYDVHKDIFYSCLLDELTEDMDFEYFFDKKGGGIKR